MTFPVTLIVVLSVFFPSMIAPIALVAWSEPQPGVQPGKWEPGLVLGSLGLAFVLPRLPYTIPMILVILFEMVIGVQRLVVVVAKPRHAIYYLRRGAGCENPTRAGWVAYVGSGDWAERSERHADDRDPEWEGWKADLDWAICGPVRWTLTRRAAYRVELRRIRALAHGARLGLTPPLENEASTKLHRGPHPILRAQLVWLRLEGRLVPERRLHLKPPSTPRHLSVSSLPTVDPDGLGDPIDVASHETDEGGERSARSEPADGSSREDPPAQPDPSASHVSSQPSHVSSHASHVSPPPPPTGESPWDEMDETREMDEMDDDDEPPLPHETRQRPVRRKRAERKAPGAPAWLDEARQLQADGFSVSMVHARLLGSLGAKAAPSRATVGRWLK